jgi:hypothetical protein
VWEITLRWCCDVLCVQVAITFLRIQQLDFGLTSSSVAKLRVFSWKERAASAIGMRGSGGPGVGKRGDEGREKKEGRKRGGVGMTEGGGGRELVGTQEREREAEAG